MSRFPSKSHAAMQSNVITRSRIFCIGRYTRVASREASQKGSFVGPDKLTFDFNSAPLTPQQVSDIEKLVNEKIVENEPVMWLK